MSKRELNTGTKTYTKISVIDTPGAGNACHNYEIVPSKSDSTPTPCYGWVSFQKGPIKESGVNGCYQEDLIAIVIDRLQSFQAGDFACRENALALTKLEEALHWLRHRTNDRIARSVEGTDQQ